MVKSFPLRRQPAIRGAAPRRHALLRRTNWIDWLKSAFDASFVFLLVGVPLLLGGRHPVGRVVYEATVLLMAVCWLVRNCLKREVHWRLSGLESIWIGGLLILVMQLLPLPVSVLARLSPFQSELLPTWFPDAASSMMLGTWNTISLTPVATRDGLAMLAAHATLFALLVQRMERLEDVERALKWVAVAVISMGTIGLLQYLSGTDYYMWVYEDPGRDASRTVAGPFINANHFAHFLALGLGAVVVWLHREGPARRERFGRIGTARSDMDPSREWRMIGLAIAGGLLLLAIVLTQSRGGMVVAMVACVGCFGTLAAARLMTLRSVGIYSVLLVIALAGLFVHGHERVQRELETLVDGTWEKLDRGAARQRVWQANLAIARRFPVLGGGVGCHAQLYKVFFPYEYGVTFSHAENGYLQVLTETGLPGAGLLMCALIALFRQAWRAWRERTSSKHAACLAAVVSGLLASAVHSLFDFPWYIPACMALTIVLLACLNRLSRLPREEEAVGVAQRALPRLARAQLAIIWLAALGVLTLTQIPAARAASAWDRYLRISLSYEPLSLSEFGQVLDAEHVAQHLERQADSTRLMARYLQEILARNPRDAEAHARLAAQCVRIFQHAQMRSENAIDLASLRDAVWASNFPDVASQDRWLQSAVGENRRWLDLAHYHLKESLNLAPLDGTSYLHLSTLVFLDGVGPEGSSRLMDQARRVRPYDADVLFASGRDHMLRGDPAGALPYWREAFRRSQDVRQHIIMFLARMLTADEFLELFEPGEDGIRLLFVFYRSAGAEEDARELAPLLASRQVEIAKSKAGRDASHMWEKAHATYRYLENSEQALLCARRAVEESPLRYQSRFIFAQELVRSGHWSEAVDAVQWCMLRRPHDPVLRRLLQTASHGLGSGQTPQATAAAPSESEWQ